MHTKNVLRAGTVALAVLLAGSAGAGLASADNAPGSPSAVAAQTPVELYSEVTAADIADPTLADSGALADDQIAGEDFEAMRTANQAINWYKNHNGSTAYQGYCERAARLSWDRKTHHASAIAHWNSSDGAKKTSGTPPKGAFVFWNISAYGHVGIADGNGGIWATSVGGKIGHAKSVNYFNNYLGWKKGNSN